jgi:glycyl-tRNA synthetase
MNDKDNKMDKIVSLCKRRGFIFQGSEIYGGLAGTWDYGPYGVTLKNNIKNLWWKMFVGDREDMYGMDAAIIMNPKTWEASGHVSGFSDPIVECVKCKKQFRADQIELIDNKFAEKDEKGRILEWKNVWKCESCGTLNKKEIHQFNMMFKTYIGADEDTSSITYLRPETAGGMFVNFKNILDSVHPKLPFGLGQIGKAFRNEIAPRDFIFRSREFEQMEVEYFVKPDEWEHSFDEWRKIMLNWCEIIGLQKSHIHELEVPDEERAHYSKRTIDIEFDYPFGRKELYGLAYRTDFDLKSHTATSSVDLSYYEEETKERFIPHVIEPSLGVDRTILAVLLEAYTEDKLGGETRTYLKLSPKIAPVKVAVFPLLKNKPQLVEKAREVYKNLRKEFGTVEFDDNGNIGKRYRRQDEIGTPFCITIDFDTIEKPARLASESVAGGDQAVTVRDRDTGKQERINEKELVAYLKEKIS